MNAWNSEYTREVMTASSGHLANFSAELKRKMADTDYAMTPDEALLLLRQITGFAESMIYLAEQVSPKELPNPQDRPSLSDLTALRADLFTR